MAFTHLLLVGTALALTFFSGSEAGEVGVCYGMMASNLIKPPAVVQLLKNNGIKAVTLYDANPDALGALASSGIEVGVSLPNENLAAAAGSMSYALQWVQSNVQAYPNTQITSVAVGNEVFHQQPQLTSQLLPAMKNIQAALASVGLADAVKVITPIALDALSASFPPSEGVFRDDLAQSVMSPMLDFLAQTGSYLSFNIYPYFAYQANPTIDINYVLFLPNNGQLDPSTGLTYYNMFDAMVDAVFHAVEKLSNSPAHTRGRKLGSTADDLTQSLRVKESGYSTGIFGPTALKHDASGLAASQAASTSDAQTYNSNLISKILRGGGTPYKPNADISANIFSLFNEDLKPGNDAERHFGLFYSDGTPVYKVDFVNPGPSPAPAASWCVANSAVGDTRLQAALDYACGHGADCSAIQAGGRCFDPNTKVAHASYAFNDYYHKNGLSDQSCYFGGCGTVVHQQPKFGNCVL